MRYNQIYRNHAWLVDNAQPCMIRRLQEQILQLNCYDQKQWCKEFASTDFYRRLKQQLPSDIIEIWNRSGYPGNIPTSREFHFQRYFAMSTFYFISRLIEKSPHQVIDLGCGGNLFKNLITGLVGIDPVHPMADICDIVDEDFVQGHSAMFDAAMALNSLHFIGLEQLSSVLDGFFSMLSPNGRGFVTFALGVMIDHTSDAAWHELFGKSAFDTRLDEIILYVDQVVRQHQHRLLIADQYYFIQDDIGHVMIGNPIDGNIRLVMEAKS